MSKKVMVVEDSAAMRKLIGSVLASADGEDWEVIEVANGFEALKVLPRVALNLVILDINMPDINGLEILSFLKSNERYRHIPIIIISTEGKDEDRRRGLALGADEYLVKPFAPEALLSVVSKLVAKKGNWEEDGKVES